MRKARCAMAIVRGRFTIYEVEVRSALVANCLFRFTRRRRDIIAQADGRPYRLLSLFLIKNMQRGISFQLAGTMMPRAFVATGRFPRRWVGGCCREWTGTDRHGRSRGLGLRTRTRTRTICLRLRSFRWAGFPAGRAGCPCHPSGVNVRNSNHAGLFWESWRIPSFYPPGGTRRLHGGQDARHYEGTGV
jgi:hypothetical protein